MEIHRFLGGIDDNLFPSRRDIFFKNVDEHVGMFHVRFTMGREVWHLRGGEI